MTLEPFSAKMPLLRSRCCRKHDWSRPKRLRLSRVFGEHLRAELYRKAHEGNIATRFFAILACSAKSLWVRSYYCHIRFGTGCSLPRNHPFTILAISSSEISSRLFCGSGCEMFLASQPIWFYQVCCSAVLVPDIA